MAYTDGFGVNFGLPRIPDVWRKRLGERKRFNPTAAIRGKWDQGDQTFKSITANLVGIAWDRESLDMMLTTADNGHRLLFVIERKTAGPTALGIYAY